MLSFVQYCTEAFNKAGFSKDLPVYHGTGHQFDHFSDDHSKKNKSAHTPAGELPGHYFTSDEGQAHSYAQRSCRELGTQKRNIVKANLHLENPKNVTAEIKRHQKAGMTFSDAKRKAYHGVDQTKHDGVYHLGSGYNHDEYVAFKAHSIKPSK